MLRYAYFDDAMMLMPLRAYAIADAADMPCRHAMMRHGF